MYAQVNSKVKGICFISQKALLKIFLFYLLSTCTADKNNRTGSFYEL